MKLVYALAAALFLSVTTLSAQTDSTSTGTKLKKETFQPDVKGDMLLQVGLNVWNGAPEVAELSNWGSKSVNVYYMYDIDLGNSHFSFHPGFGLAFEKYAFESRVNLLQDPAATGTDGAPAIGLISVDDILGYDFDAGSGNEVRKNKLGASYLEIPLELSYATKKDNPRAGWKFVVGGRAGLLLGSQTKIKYRVADDTRKYKLRQDYNLNPFRYSAHTRVGYGGFSLYFDYQFTEVFDAGNAPTFEFGEGANLNTGNLQDISNWRIGIAIDLF